MGKGSGSNRKFLAARWCATALVALAGVLTGCQNIQGSSPQALVRVIDASYNAPAIDVKVGTTLIATNIGAGTIANYADLPPQMATVYVYPTGKTTPLTSVAGNFAGNTQHSLFLTDSGATFAATILTDQIVAPPAGYFSVRILQQALTTGAVDVYFVPGTSTLAGTKPLVSDVAAGTVSGYINVPIGTYTVDVTPAGDIKSPYISSSLTFATGAVRTLLIMDAQLTTNPPVTVVIGNDAN